MRKPSALAALFPTVRGEVLMATLPHPDKWWYLSELAEFVGTTPSSLQRELKALVRGGILETRREGTRGRVRRARDLNPHFPAPTVAAGGPVAAVDKRHLLHHHCDAS